MTGTDPLLTWRDDGAPQSILYGDVYFSSDDGLAESQAVYLDGCGLPHAWAERRHFTVGELGFGTGLNIAALLMRWRDNRPPGALLHVFSVEAHLMDVADARRALSRWPQIGPAAGALLAAWPPAIPGFHRIDLPAFGAVLDLAVMGADEALDQWTGQADAWLLDGFSPALNPQMWSPALMLAVANRSAPGARAATFTVAGAVRRALTEAGFVVEKKPGFGRKRERLEAVFPGERPRERPPQKIAIVGAGIAGVSLARAFRALGLEPVLMEAGAPGSGASGNPSALVTPAFDAGQGARARLYAQAYRRAVQLYREIPGAVIATGAVQREATVRDEARFDKLAASPLFDDLTRMPGGLHLSAALTIDPMVVMPAWASGARHPISGSAGDLRGYDAVVLAMGADLRSFWPEAPIQSVRGQASWATGVSAPYPTAFGGYAIPTREGVLFGATHDRNDEDEAVRQDDHRRNLDLLIKGAPDLAAVLANAPLEGRARRRAATPDRLPMAGAIPGKAGFFVLGGLGSRGFCTAPLLAEHVAALVVGTASPLPASLSTSVDPARPALWRGCPDAPI